MTEVESRVTVFGQSLGDRLPNWQIDFALSYVVHGEAALAIETIIDNMRDENVKLTAAEHDELSSLVSYLSGPGRISATQQASAADGP